MTTAKDRPWRRLRGAERYPETPVVYSLRTFRIVFGLLSLLGSAIFVATAYQDHEPVPRPNVATDWLFAMAPLIWSLGYQYYTVRVALDGTHLRVKNPFRCVDIPLGHITAVEQRMESFLLVRTRYRTFWVLGVERNPWRGMSAPRVLRRLTVKAADRATNQTDPPARYRQRVPDPITLIALATIVAISPVPALLGLR